MPTTTPLLTFLYTADHPWPVREKTQIYEDGQLIHLIQAALDPDHRNQAGFYIFHLSADQQKAVRHLAESLAALPSQANQTRPEGVQISLQAIWNGQAQTHAITLGFPPSHPVLAEALILGQTLRNEALGHPRHVLKLSLKIAPTPVFIVESIGTEPITFLLQPETLALMNGVEPMWQNEAHSLMGLVDGMGRLVDGLHAAATLAPHSKATLALPMVPYAASPSWYARLEGVLSPMTASGDMAEDPELPFRVHSLSS